MTEWAAIATLWPWRRRDPDDRVLSRRELSERLREAEGELAGLRDQLNRRIAAAEERIKRVDNGHQGRLERLEKRAGFTLQ